MMTAKDWQAWDHTAAYLQALQYQARMMQHHVSEMTEILTMMKDRPKFVTLTEEAMTALDKQLTNCQTAFRQVQEGFIKLPQTA